MVRTRFAPSPTGYLHVGGLRTALYNFLYARQYDGAFVLRIEDTDQRRKVAGAIENLLNTLRWAGVQPDEGPECGGQYGPYVQSQRLPIYQDHIKQLLANGHAYRCFCSPEHLATLRNQQHSDKTQSGYDRHCRDLSSEEINRQLNAGIPYVVRMKIPLTGTIEFEDLIRGRLSFACDLLEDQILQKSDGFPTYHLAHLVDDHLMQITHVIRGEEWLSSTPKHILLYDYFGWTAPQFAHVPLLLNPDRSKLSKRQGDVSVEEYCRKGYLPEALVNFLALLGWNPGTDQEIFTLEELIKSFSLERINKAGAIFNLEKLQWLNGKYIRDLDPATLLEKARAFLPSTHQQWSKEELLKILQILQPYLSTFADIAVKGWPFFSEPVINDTPEKQELIRNPEFSKILSLLQKEIATISELEKPAFTAIVMKIQQETAIKGKVLWSSIRLALTGEIHGPDIGQVAEIIGKERCMKRLEKALTENA
jgi:nondiscriminating glutamyl-tRNA synthetase